MGRIRAQVPHFQSVEDHENEHDASHFCEEPDVDGEEESYFHGGVEDERLPLAPPQRVVELAQELGPNKGPRQHREGGQVRHHVVQGQTNKGAKRDLHTRDGHKSRSGSGSERIGRSEKVNGNQAKRYDPSKPYREGRVSRDRHGNKHVVKVRRLLDGPEPVLEFVEAEGQGLPAETPGERERGQAMASVELDQARRHDASHAVLVEGVPRVKTREGQEVSKRAHDGSPVPQKQEDRGRVRGHELAEKGPVQIEGSPIVSRCDRGARGKQRGLPTSLGRRRRLTFPSERTCHRPSSDWTSSLPRC